MKLHKCEIILPVDRLNVGISAIFANNNVIKNCVYVVHDKGGTYPHYHILLHFGSASVDIKQVAKWFQLDYKDEQGNEHNGTQFVRNVVLYWANVVKYLSHDIYKPIILKR